jgi:hypothetical protein
MLAISGVIRPDVGRRRVGEEISFNDPLAYLPGPIRALDRFRRSLITFVDGKGA